MHYRERRPPDDPRERHEPSPMFNGLFGHRNPHEERRQRPEQRPRIRGLFNRPEQQEDRRVPRREPRHLNRRYNPKRSSHTPESLHQQKKSILSADNFNKFNQGLQKLQIGFSLYNAFKESKDQESNQTDINDHNTEE